MQRIPNNMAVNLALCLLTSIRTVGVMEPEIETKISVWLIQSFRSWYRFLNILVSTTRMDAQSSLMHKNYKITKNLVFFEL